MSLMLGQLYRALKSAGASEDEANNAAAEVASYENRLAKIETDLAMMKSDMTTLKWMLGYVIAALTAVLIRVFA